MIKGYFTPLEAADYATGPESADSPKPAGHRLLRLPEVSRLVGLQRSQIYDLMRIGDFPSSITLCGGPRVAWIESEVQAWIELQIRPTRDRAALTDAGASGGAVTLPTFPGFKARKGRPSRVWEPLPTEAVGARTGSGRMKPINTPVLIRMEFVGFGGSDRVRLKRLARGLSGTRPPSLDARQRNLN